MAETRSGASPTRGREAGATVRALRARSGRVFALVLVCLGDWQRNSKTALVLGIASTFLALGLRVVTGQDLIFSHRNHLARGATQCETCHASALSSAAAQDNHRPEEKTCLVCHDGAQARKECAVCHRNPQKAVGGSISCAEFSLQSQAPPQSRECRARSRQRRRWRPLSVAPRRPAALSEYR